VKLPIPLVRLGYRCAYHALQLYWLIARPTVHGVKCVVTNRERVLLVRHSYGPRVWDLPGGGVKAAESAIVAARREMAEELGIEIDGWRPLGEVRGRVGNRHDRMDCFHAEAGSRPLAFDAGEIVVGAWFPLDQLPPHTGRYVKPIVELLA
jgi:8-oxo-dGTP pyrophosphatase MutT (NUDIX family)